MTIFSNRTKSHLEANMFLDGPVGIVRSEKVKYPVFQGFTEQQWGFFWQPQEVEIYRDSKEFKTLTSQEQHIFTSNLYRQILLDSKQGRAPVGIFGAITSLPEIEEWCTVWQAFESIHSKSYTYIIKNLYSDPSKVFDEIENIPELTTCAADINKYYDALIVWNTLREIKENENFFSKFLRWVSGNYYNEYDHKKALWLALIAANALEGIRFYVSFACSWAFAETKRMEGNAKIIKLICRDENVHLGVSQQILKLLPREDPDFAKIEKECQPEAIQIYRDVINQECAWAHYLFKDGSMIGLNEELLVNYVYWIGNRRMKTIKLPEIFKDKVGSSNPLPWTQKWISGSNVQVAPQEVTSSQYIIGGTKQDLTPETLSKFRL